MEHADITEKIIGCAYQVYNRMGFGYLESVYENCLMIELRRARLKAEQQAEIKVSYEGEEVGYFKADILVEGVVIVELKSVHRLAQAQEVQLVNYLVATGKTVGLLINFGPDKVHVQRKVRSLKVRRDGSDNPVNPVILSDSSG